MKPKIYILLCCIIVCSIFIAAIWLLSKERFDSIPIIEGEEKNEYIIHHNELIPREDIAAFTVEDGKIYLFFDETALVNVYDIKGVFQYGIQIATIQNSHGDIAVLNGKLFIKSRLPVIFVFENDKMIEIIDLYSSYEKYILTREMFLEEKNTADGGYIYQLSKSGNDIVRQDTQETVIDLPQKCYIAEYLLLAGALVICVFIEGFNKIFKDR